MTRAAGRPYRAIAACYDEIFGPMRDWATAARKQILGSILPRAASACDIACGTGETAVELAAMGIRMYAVDLSREMCRLSEAKARRARLPLRVLHADMRDFRLPEPVDLVLCEFDAINLVAFRKLWPVTFWVGKPRTGLVMH